MLLLGHPGITLGIAVLLNGVFSKHPSSSTETNGEIHHSDQTSEITSDHPGSTTGKLSWITLLARTIDIRILLIGSLLSDITDKPLGRFFFREALGNGRTISHTLLFLILLTTAGFYRYKKRGGLNLFALSFGTFTHLVFDQMWRTPQTLFWPVYGFSFPRSDLTAWIPNMLKALLTNPQVYVPEVLGAIILGWFTMVLVRKRAFFRFLIGGQVQ
ncbi:metal-dependent hydrolase [Chloroflexota bacterium]